MNASPRAHDKDTLDQQTLNRAYARWAPIYDVVFGAVFDCGRKASIEAAEQVGGRILDVGIGTGISLMDFSRRNRIVGVDISEPMLRRARRRVIEADLDNVECLAVMDAERLGFPDNFFDVVVAQYVITAVPNPDATLSEFARVTRPGGEIVLVNHIGADSGLAPFVRARFCADRPRTGLAARVSVRTHRELDRARRRRSSDRAPPDAAARSLLADPHGQGRLADPQIAGTTRDAKSDRSVQPRSARSRLISSFSNAIACAIPASSAIVAA